MIARRGLAVILVASILSACGGSSSSSSDGRDRNIAGGGEIAITSVPYEVALARFDVVDGKQQGTGGACGGSIIAPEWVLTAEHCVHEKAGSPIYPDAIYVGSGDPSFGKSVWSASHRIGAEVYIARNTTEPNPGLDLALIKVNRPFVYSDSVQPIALPVGLDRSTWPKFASLGFISGWGNDLQGNSQANLRGVAMKLNNAIDSAYCFGDPGDRRGYFWGTFDAAKHLCLQRPDTTAPAAACSGDSGGPFTVMVADKPVIAGVASQAAAPSVPLGQTANYCTGTVPNLYVRVSAGLDWILPGAVRSLTARAGDGRVDLSWTEPASLPALPITDYQIDVRAAGSTTWATLNDGISATPGAVVSGLKNGDTLDVRVSGLNAVNSGSADLREFVAMTVTAGASREIVVAPTTTMPTATTLATVSTTVAPSTTARAVTIGTKPTSTVPTSSVTTTTVDAVQTTTTAPTTTPATTGPATTVPANVIAVRTVDPSFDNPPLPADFKKPEVSETTQPKGPIGPQRVVGASWSAADVAASGNINIPNGALVSVTAKSSKVCKSSGSSIVLVGKGTCKVAVSVKVGSGKPKNKTVSIKVS